MSKLFPHPKFLSVNSLVWTIFLSFTLLTVSNHGWAKAYLAEKSENIAKKKEILQEIITDYANYCISGCKYTLEGIKEMKIVEKNNPNHFYVWVHVGGPKTYKYFSQIDIIPGSINNGYCTTIRNTYPSEEDATRLQNEYNLPHNVPFDSSVATWTLTERYDTSGNFLYTTVNYSAEMQTSSMLLNIMGRIIKKTLNRTAEDLFTSLKM